MQPASADDGDSGFTRTAAPTELSGFVLAGGRSSRLGRDKALLPWPPNAFAKGKSQTLLQHAVARLQSVCTIVSICANRPDLFSTAEVIPDAVPGSGPLGGIVAALEHSSTEWNLLLAVDLPFLPVQVLQALAARARSGEKIRLSGRPSSPSPACILPELDGLPQPLCGLYHRALAPKLRRALEAGKLKVMAALQQATDPEVAGAEISSDTQPFRVEMWDVASFAAALPSTPDPRRWFFNINTREEWEKARQLRTQ